MRVQAATSLACFCLHLGLISCCCKPWHLGCLELPPGPHAPDFGVVWCRAAKCCTHCSVIYQQRPRLARPRPPSCKALLDWLLHGALRVSALAGSPRFRLEAGSVCMCPACSCTLQCATEPSGSAETARHPAACFIAVSLSDVSVRCYAWLRCPASVDSGRLDSRQLCRYRWFQSSEWWQHRPQSRLLSDGVPVKALLSHTCCWPLRQPLCARHGCGGRKQAAPIELVCDSGVALVAWVLLEWFLWCCHCTSCILCAGAAALRRLCRHWLWILSSCIGQWQDAD